MKQPLSVATQLQVGAALQQQSLCAWGSIGKLGFSSPFSSLPVQQLLAGQAFQLSSSSRCVQDTTLLWLCNLKHSRSRGQVAQLLLPFTFQSRSRVWSHIWPEPKLSWAAYLLIKLPTEFLSTPQLHKYLHFSISKLTVLVRGRWWNQVSYCLTDLNLFKICRFHCSL